MPGRRLNTRHPDIRDWRQGLFVVSLRRPSAANRRCADSCLWCLEPVVLRPIRGDRAGRGASTSPPCGVCTLRNSWRQDAASAKVSGIMRRTLDTRPLLFVRLLSLEPALEAFRL